MKFVIIFSTCFLLSLSQKSKLDNEIEVKNILMPQKDETLNKRGVLKKLIDNGITKEKRKLYPELRIGKNVAVESVERYGKGSLAEANKRDKVLSVRKRGFWRRVFKRAKKMFKRAKKMAFKVAKVGLKVGLKAAKIAWKHRRKIMALAALGKKKK